MDQYILEHADRYRSLVRSFKPAGRQGGTNTATVNPDVVVATRIRPLLSDEVSSGVPQGIFPRTGSDGVVDVHELKKPIRGPPLPTLRSADFRSDRLFNCEATTEDIYQDLVKPLVPWAWDGGIGTLFAYGQTGSGKTFTVSHLGRLVARSLMGGSMAGERRVNLTVFELAGNSPFDLLNGRRAISVLEDSFGVTQLAGAVELHVESAGEVLDLIEKAMSFRRTESTEKNDASSRSHAICRFRIENPSVPEAEDGILYLIDLAGSEAARDTRHHTAERIKETREINSSLSVLKDCIRGKAESDSYVAAGSRKKRHIPFRQSSLTKVLKHVFDPTGTRSCKTVVIACVNPSLLDTGPSKNTLRYAEMLRVLVPKTKMVQYDPEAPMAWSHERLTEWIDHNSGDPAISSTLLAPSESGAQLLRLLESEFESRCLKTSGVTPEQARAFRSKIWQMHVDSQRKSSSGPESFTPDFVDKIQGLDRSSSRDPIAERATYHFKERIRPGMVLAWDPPPNLQHGAPGTMSMAVILCPLAPGDTEFSYVLNHDHLQPFFDQENDLQRYLCALVSPGIMAGSYQVDMWRHVIISKGQIKDEVILEYDDATRYYYIAV